MLRDDEDQPNNVSRFTVLEKRALRHTSSSGQFSPILSSQLTPPCESPHEADRALSKSQMLVRMLV